MMDIDQDKLKAVEKILGAPSFGDIPENALKVRRNLISASLISIFIVLGGLEIDPTSTFLGLKFSGITQLHIIKTLFLFSMYFLIHFLWYCFESFSEWKLRLTGTKVAFLTGAKLGHHHADYPSDPKQSTLYNWWLESANRIKSYKATLKDIEEKITTLNSSLQDDPAANRSLLPQLNEKVTELTKIIKDSENLAYSDRVLTSLTRFDNWFKYFLIAQNLRWFFVEMLFPISLGAIALILLA